MVAPLRERVLGLLLQHPGAQVRLQDPLALYVEAETPREVAKARNEVFVVEVFALIARGVPGS